MKKRLIVIGGPTASGKSDVAVAVAQRLTAPVVSCDSRQFFCEIPVGTAAPTAEQMSVVPHYMVGCRSVSEPYNAGAFEVDALALLDRLFESHDCVVMVGGSGMYINAVCDGMDDIPAVPDALRHELAERLESEGLAALVEELRTLDPEYAATVDTSNPRRVLRGLEVSISSGKPFSSFRSGTVRERPFEVVRVAVSMPRDVLYDRINRRVDMMLNDGLEAEARAVYAYRSNNALQTVGYREMFDYFDGLISLEQAVELIKRNSRRYAKRQFTWFGNDGRYEWFDSSDISSITEYIEKFK